MTRARTPLLYALAVGTVAASSWHPSLASALVAAVAIAAVLADGLAEWRTALSEMKAHRAATEAVVSGLRTDVDELRKEFRGFKNVRALSR